MVDERALDLLLAPAPDGSGQRVVGKKGVRVAGGDFVSPDLAGIEGCTVDVRYDPADMGVIYLFDPRSGAFLARAVCPEREGIDRRAVAIEVKRRQRQIVADGRKKLRRMSKAVRAEGVAQEILDAASAPAGRVVALPRRADPVDTAALAAAAQAARSADAPEPTRLTTRQQEMRQRIAAEQADPAPRPATDASLRRDRADRVEAAIAAGAPVDPADALWITGYQRTAEYRARKALAG